MALWTCAFEHLSSAATSATVNTSSWSGIPHRFRDSEVAPQLAAHLRAPQPWRESFDRTVVGGTDVITIVFLALRILRSSISRRTSKALLGCPRCCAKSD